MLCYKIDLKETKNERMMREKKKSRCWSNPDLYVLPIWRRFSLLFVFVVSGASGLFCDCCCCRRDLFFFLLGRWLFGGIADEEDDESSFCSSFWLLFTALLPLLLRVLDQKTARFKVVDLYIIYNIVRCFVFGDDNDDKVDDCFIISPCDRRLLFAAAEDTNREEIERKKNLKI